MRYASTFTFRFQGQIYKIELEEDDNQISVEIDGKPVPVGYERIEENLYSIILEGKSITLGVLKKSNNIEIFLNGDLYQLHASKR